MKTGDLVTYKRKDPHNGFSHQVGLVMGRCPIIELDDWLLIQWTSGAKFAENRKLLKLVKN